MGMVIYDYLDQQPYAGVNYYRIRMQDTSGNVFYSPVLAFSFVNKHILLYPNPATSYVMVVNPTSMYVSDDPGARSKRQNHAAGSG